MKNNKLHSVILCISLAISIAFVSLGAAVISPGPISYAAVDLIAIESETSSLENEKEQEQIDLDEYAKVEWEEIEVDDEQKLAEVIRLSRLDTWSHNKYIKLTDDIHLTDKEFEYFTTFGGIFDGNGHKIDGLKIKSSMSYLGFFSKLQPCGVVKNLTVEGSITPDKKQIVVGGIVGDNYGTIDGCRFMGVVKGNDYTGGIVGYNEVTGIIMNCITDGTVIGQHYTGGIAGTNCGGIYNSTNNAQVNTSNVDRSMSIEDINIETYLNGIMDIGGDTSEGKTLDTTNNTVDTGGIVGHTSGIVQYCINQGNVGYERVGYNIGGIAGRQSGYIHECKNNAYIQGRKDVGGIVGQAEPYVELDFTEDVINKLTENINELHDLVNKTLSDSGDTSNQISDRIAVVQKFVDNALDDTSYLTGETINFINGLTDAGNEVINRADYAMDEAGKDGGAIEKTKDAMDGVSKASDNLKDAVNKADVYSKMSESDRTRYDNDTAVLKAARDEHQKYYDSVNSNNFYYYVYHDSKTTDESKDYKDKENDLEFYKVDSDGNEIPYDVNELVANYSVEKLELRIYHAGKKSFPSSEEQQSDYDAKLIKDATEDASKASNDYADNQFKSVNGRKKPDGSSYLGDQVAYSVYIADYSNDLVAVVEPYAKQAAEESQPDLENATQNLSKAADDLSNAALQSSDIVRNLANRDDITLPRLTDGYKTHTSSFVANLQGMSENLSLLNGEMNSSSDVIIDDMADVNDSFNKIMILFTDALDGALDGEYADKYEDESFEVATECTDGTVAGCINTGIVEGDLDVAGIAGSMGIEYDFDLEGDVTSNKDAKINSTFKTKCVLRTNKNEGRITAHKSYVGGVVGTQEMGTILNGENYGRIVSSTGDYVGGIAGNSIASIVGCYSRGIMSGDEYVGGIAGYGHEIYDSYSIVAITKADSFFGAIAGEVDDDSKLKNNYFVSDYLAGIDRISYSNIAEPISFDTIKVDEQIPDELKKLQITFLVNDEVIGTRSIEFGKGLDESQYPESITKQDYYIDWDESIVHDVTTDMEIVGEPMLYRTTIASPELRDNKQSVLLVDGKFKVGQSLDVTEYIDPEENELIKGSIERWEVSVPKDGLDSHQFRFQLPEGITKASIYIKTDGDYYQVDTNTMGMYQLFNANGSKVSIIIVDDKWPVWYIAIGCAICIIAAVTIIVIVRGNKNNKHKKKKHSQKERKEIKEKKKKRKKQARNKRRQAIENGIEKAQQLLEEAKDDSPRGEK